MNLFVKFFGCGNVNLRSNTNRCDFYVQDLNEISDNIISHFDKYTLYNIKSLDFYKFKEAAELLKIDRINNKEVIKIIISKMKTKR
jgi:hypothetical protein